MRHRKSLLQKALKYQKIDRGALSGISFCTAKKAKAQFLLASLEHADVVRDFAIPCGVLPEARAEVALVKRMLAVAQTGHLSRNG
jgi:hypothetical protein